MTFYVIELVEIIENAEDKPIDNINIGNDIFWTIVVGKDINWLIYFERQIGQFNDLVIVGFQK